VTAPTTQIYQVFIKASPERIWDAIVNPDLTEHYFHGSRIEITAERRVSRGPDGTLRGDGWVAEYDPPRRLVHEWRPMYDPDLAREESSRVTWEIEPHEDGYCKLTLTHDNLEGAPRTAQHVSGEGWMFVLSGLKTLLETGGRLDGANARADATPRHASTGS
jgi:uncharacterized protein YndB with AHSA1/START domain